MVGANIRTSGSSPNFQEQPCHEGWHERQTIELFKDVIPYAIPTYKPDIVLVEMGTNGCVYYDDHYAEAAPYFDSCVTLIHKLLPNAYVIVSPIPPYVDPNQQTFKTHIDTYNATIKATVLRKQGEGKRISWLDEMAWTTADLNDDVHPSMPAHYRWAGIWYRAIDALATTALLPEVKTVSQLSTPSMLVDKGIISVSLATQEPVTLSIHTLAGRLIAQSTVTPSNGRVSNVQPLNKGVVVVTISGKSFAPIRRSVIVR